MKKFNLKKKKNITLKLREDSNFELDESDDSKIKSESNSDNKSITDHQLNNDRHRIRNVFSKILNSDLGEKCELSIYRKLKKDTRSDFPNDKFKQEYLEVAFNLIENLDPEGCVGNSYLLPRVMKGDIDVDNLAYMSNQELFPPKWDEIVKKRLEEIKHENEENEAVTTDMFKCGNCKQRKCQYYQMQTRSSDEPMTCFITCMNCGNKWRQ